MFYDIAVTRFISKAPAEERATFGDGERYVFASSDPHSNDTIERRDPMRCVLQQQQRTEGRGALAQNNCKGEAGAKSTDPLFEITMT